MRFTILLCAFILLSSHAMCYTIPLTRDELIAGYYSKVADKIPKSARLLLGDETVNAYIGQSVVGVRTRNGELAELELYALDNPTITITVDDSSIGRMAKGEIGIQKAISDGGIRIKTSNLYSAFKVEALKRIYFLSGADLKLTSKKNQSAPAWPADSTFIKRARIVN